MTAGTVAVPNARSPTAGTLASVRGTRMGASPVMVGRDEELRQLKRLLAAERPRVAPR